MKTLSAILFACCFALTAFGQQLTLNGSLMTDAKASVPATRISVHGIENTTDSKGQFKLVLSGDFSEGERVIIKVDKPGWVINYPLDGEWNLPNVKLQNIQTLNVIIVPKGSKSLWTHARIEKQIAKMSDEIAKLKKEGDTPRPIDFSFYLREWAEQCGFTPEQVKAAFDDWAKVVEKSDDYRTLGLRAFYQNNFPLAAENFVKAAQKDEGQIKSVQEQLDRKILSAYQNRKDAGNSLTNSYQFREALEQYNLAKLRITELISKDKHRYEQTEIEVLIGNAKQGLGIRVEGEEGNRLLSEAVDSYKRTLAVITREQSPQDWAMTQNSLGNALQSQGARMAGDEGVKLLAEAVSACRNALLVYTREQLPQDWAATQNSLGNALRSQGARMAGDEGVKLLAEAVTAFRNALLVYTREQLPQQWAGTQNNLGYALQSQGERMGGDEGVKLLAEAVSVCRNALLVYTREQLPQQWAGTQNNLGNALSNQAVRAEGAEGARLYAEAVQAYRQSLTVRTREQLPQDWAMTQNNLGNALSGQAARAEGAERARLYAEAVQAYRQALTVYTREQLPQDWAMTQNNLGNALRAQAARAEGAEGARLYAEAVQAYRQALTVRTREQLPQDWAMTQNNLGNALSNQAARAEGAEGARLYAEAVQAYRQALTVYTREQLPQGWAMTQNNLGNALSNQAARAEGAEGARLYAEAVQAYRQALTVYTREQLPQGWAATQNNLGTALHDQAESLGGESGARLAREAIQAFEAALQIYERATLPQDWLMTQNNMAETYYLIEDWLKAARAYDNVLSMRPNNEQVLSRLSGIYHEQLFRLAEAFALNERRVKLDSADLSAQSDWAETHFTTARFAEAETRLAALLANPKLRSSTQTALCVIEIANALALGKAESVKPKLAALIAAVAQQPADFRVGWSFNGTLHFIGQNEKLAPYREWLRQLFNAVQAENRDAIVKGLSEAKGGFKL